MGRFSFGGLALIAVVVAAAASVPCSSTWKSGGQRFQAKVKRNEFTLKKEVGVEQLLRRHVNHERLHLPQLIGAAA